MTHVPDGWRLVPEDDEARPFADSNLPAEMIRAGELAIDRADEDLKNYISGETIDWDSGMIAVAVFRAMLAAAPTPPASGEGDALRAELLAAADRAKANKAHVGKQVRAMVRGHDLPGVDYVGLFEALAQYEALFRKVAAAQSPSLAEEVGRLREALNGTLGLIRKAQERLCSYLAPEGSDDLSELTNDLLYMFDGPEQREIEGRAREALSTYPSPTQERDEACE